MIYVLLPVHNRRPITEAFAQGLARQTVTDFHLILLDDGSTDGTSDAVRNVLAERVTVLRGTGKWWWGGALHHGWLWLAARSKTEGLRDSDVILTCNDDVELPDDFLAQGLALLAEHPRSLAVAKTRNAATGQLEETCYTIDYLRNKVALAKPGETPVCAPTRGLFVRWSDMRSIGGFHPRLIPHYLSDLDWTLRAHRRGLAICRDDRLWLHSHADMTGLHSIGGLPLIARLQRTFSTKYAQNPLHWTAFILLGFPARYWLPALARIGLWTLGGICGVYGASTRRR
jgi:GT2 family glycosyltransferase